MENDIMETVKQYADALKHIQNYIPDANMEEIYVFEALKRFLSAKTEIAATRAIIETNTYFQDAIGFKPSRRLFDAEKLKALVKKYSMAVSPDELLAKMRGYSAMVLKQEKEKNNLSLQVVILNNLLQSTLQKGATSAAITAKPTKKRFEAAIRLMEDPSFQALQGVQQASILNDVVVAGESVETALKRQLVNHVTDKTI